MAARYRYADGRGEIGIISSVTEPFCRDCNRARLSADGKLFTCLFASEGSDLLGLLRSGSDDEVLSEFVAGIWGGRRTATAMSGPPSSETEPRGKKSR